MHIQMRPRAQRATGIRVSVNLITPLGVLQTITSAVIVLLFYLNYGPVLFVSARDARMAQASGANARSLARESVPSISILCDSSHGVLVAENMHSTLIFGR